MVPIIFVPPFKARGYISTCPYAMLHWPLPLMEAVPCKAYSVILVHIHSFLKLGCCHFGRIVFHISLPYMNYPPLFKLVSPFVPCIPQLISTAKIRIQSSNDSFLSYMCQLIQESLVLIDTPLHQSGLVHSYITKQDSPRQLHAYIYSLQ